MSKFKAGDWVVRYLNVETAGFYGCETGKPVKIVSIDKGWITFLEKEGGEGWNAEYFREAKPEDFSKYEITIPSIYKTERTLEDVKLDLAKKLEEVERLKKELEEIENPMISVSIPKNRIEDFVVYCNDRISFSTPPHYIWNLLKESLEQHNAKVAQ